MHCLKWNKLWLRTAGSPRTVHLPGSLAFAQVDPVARAAHGEVDHPALCVHPADRGARRPVAVEVVEDLVVEHVNKASVCTDRVRMIVGLDKEGPVFCKQQSKHFYQGLELVHWYFLGAQMGRVVRLVFWDKNLKIWFFYNLNYFGLIFFLTLFSKFWVLVFFLLKSSVFGSFYDEKWRCGLLKWKWFWFDLIWFGFWKMVSWSQKKSDHPANGCFI